MELYITIRQDNAAFEDSGVATETSRILRELAERIESEGPPDGWILRDMNGNRTGIADTRGLNR